MPKEQSHIKEITNEQIAHDLAVAATSVMMQKELAETIKPDQYFYNKSIDFYKKAKEYFKIVCDEEI